MNAVLSNDVESYLDAVRAALGDLPPGVRDELLEDLPEHLAEVAAESDGPLAERLGPPAEYAAELRAAAGVSGAVGGGALVRWGRRWSSFGMPARVRAADAAAGRVVGYPRFGEFLRQLLPAWWVVRGYAVAVLVIWAFAGWGWPSHRVGSPMLALLALLLPAAPFIAFSVWLGRRSQGGPVRRRAARVLANVALALVILIAPQVGTWDWHDGPVYSEMPTTSYVRMPTPYVPPCEFDEFGRPVVPSTWQYLGEQRCVYLPPHVVVPPRTGPLGPTASPPTGGPSSPQPSPTG